MLAWASHGRPTRQFNFMPVDHSLTNRLIRDKGEEMKFLFIYLLLLCLIFFFFFNLILDRSFLREFLRF